MKKAVRTKKITRSMGWLSVGLGLAELVAPGRFSHWLGVRQHPWLIRALGLRELGSGLGLIAQPRQAGWIWTRVAGDALDLGLIGAALKRHPGRRSTKMLVFGALLGVTGLDLYLGRSLSRRWISV